MEFETYSILVRQRGSLKTILACEQPPIISLKRIEKFTNSLTDLKEVNTRIRTCRSLPTVITKKWKEIALKIIIDTPERKKEDGFSWEDINTILLFIPRGLWRVLKKIIKR